MKDEPPVFETLADQETWMRKRYRELVHTASNKDEAAELLAIYSELAQRGYRLNEDESDWIK